MVAQKRIQGLYQGVFTPRFRPVSLRYSRPGLTSDVFEYFRYACNCLYPNRDAKVPGLKKPLLAQKNAPDRNKPLKWIPGGINKAPGP